MDIFDNESAKIAEGVIEQLKAEIEALTKAWERLENRNVDMMNENDDLKRLLRLAIEDMSSEASFCCAECVHRHTGYDKCGDNNCFKWKHADEAMKLLGEENVLQ